MNAFEAAVANLEKASEPSALQFHVKEILALGASNQADKVKAYVAIILQKKCLQELQSVKDQPVTTKIVDKKYQDLAKLLRETPVTGNPIRAERLNQTNALSPASKLPAKPNNLSGWNLMQAWLNSKKKYIVHAGIAGTVVSAALYAYNRFYKTKQDQLKVKRPELNQNPQDKDLQDLEKTFRVLEQFRTFSKLSNEGTLSPNTFTDLLRRSEKLTDKSKQMEIKKLELKKKQSKWEAAESNLLKSMEDASKGITMFKPRKELRLPSLDTIIPSYEVLSTEPTPTKVEPKKRAKAVKKKPKIEHAEKAVAVTVTPAKKEVKVNSEPAKVESSLSKLVPVVKLAKRIRRVTGD